MEGCHLISLTMTQPFTLPYPGGELPLHSAHFGSVPGHEADPESLGWFSLLISLTERTEQDDVLDLLGATLCPRGDLGDCVPQTPYKKFDKEG